ncbi:myelin-oligodendrocyte glycoprotein-like isoform X2 [Trachinotus anak]|uniref:myelin-oligodendrocyte glycoprotein-like isoform X2 n=1 Tax=Trachinotus anak TaxID=443729 RepID=UPI0039F17387
MAFKLTFLVLLFSGTAAEFTGNPEVKGSPQPIRATVGQDVILPCHLDPPFDVRSLTVEWRCNTTRVHVYRNKRDDPNSQHKDFKTRTSLFHDEMSKGNLSLKLSSVNKTDTGNYTCYVPNLDSQVKKGHLVLIVEDTPQLTVSSTPAAVTVDKDAARTDYNQQLGLGLGLGLGLPLIIVIIAVMFGYFICKGRREENRKSENNPLNMVNLNNDNN